ncbi:hypothetical protein AAFF_G00435280 [Aldrovandia affinis]|uniref:Tudor domain-containing protein 7B-like n=1 Tax=Aldrovandia affinis TaxID=143900 RepID=A0AAD7S8D3_9TELE|nr:hypothetical protein AAFF_G00435280 [Aldrovandia affinis]
MKEKPPGGDKAGLPSHIRDRMSDPESVKKMLRAVLQSCKSAVSLTQLQADYKSLTGDYIPHKHMGYPTLDAFLHSVPTVVKMEQSRTGEVVCSAVDSKETAHITQLVARQRSSNKTGRPQLVNCQMRVKLATPFILNAKPRKSLRQPDHTGLSVRVGTQSSTRGRSGGLGDHRQVSMRDTQPDGRASTPPQNRTPPATAQTRKASVPSGRSDKRMTLPSRFQKEVQAHLSKNPQQTSAPSNLNENGPPAKPTAPQPGGGGYSPQVVQTRIKEVLHKHSNGLWVSKLPQLYRELYKQELPADALTELETWTHICTVEKAGSCNPTELLLYPSKDPPRPSSAPRRPALRRPEVPHPHPPKVPHPDSPTSPLPHPTLSPGSGPLPTAPPAPSTTPPPARALAQSTTPTTPPPARALAPDIKAKLGELLVKYGNGVWAHALPKLFLDTYKTELPAHALRDLSLLADICTIDYPVPDNPKKAILHARAGEDENRNLTGPAEEYPSVLVVEASSTSRVILRYIGEGYSQAQEALEDEMREFYGQNHTGRALPSPAPGLLAAVRAEGEEEVLRAQVCEVRGDRVKVYYVDHGFSEVTSRGKLLELQERFYTLPFQAAECKLAGLEPFCQEPAVLKRFESLACGRILLAEILERDETPLVVLYDTSQDDDVNINAACMKALHDQSLENPLQVNSAYTNVCVTNVCSDGTIYCQLPSRGQAKLNEMLEKTEAYFLSQVTSEFLVSKPFCGKCCLARYKGKWSRVEITNLHGSRVLDIQFVDLGVPASVEAIELREVPPPFLRDLITIPPQVSQSRNGHCLGAKGMVHVVSSSLWTWALDPGRPPQPTDCSMKIAKLDEAGRMAHVYLFTSKNLYEAGRSVNHQLADSDLWKHQKDVFLSNRSPAKTNANSNKKTNSNANADTNSNATRNGTGSPSPKKPPPPPNMDIYVSVACHPGHFVLQPWQDLYKLLVLMGEMVLHYNKMEEQPIRVEKNQIYAAKVENNWHRVLVKGVLTNGLVSVYELDYGKHELVSVTQLRPLTQEFRQLPVQGITAQLAGVKPRQWSEEASIVFRNHVEKKPLVAQVEAVQEAAHPGTGRWRYTWWTRRRRRRTSGCTTSCPSSPTS